MSDFAATRVVVTSSSKPTLVMGGGHEWGNTDMRVHNTGRVTLYLGGSDVSPDNGYPLRADEQIAFERVSRWTRLFAVNAGTQAAGELRVLRRET